MYINIQYKKVEKSWLNFPSRNVSASTQRQALNAIIFLYRHVLDQPIEEQIEPTRAKRHPRPPVVMSKNEVQRVLAQMQGIHLLMAKMLYGAGLRLMECIRLRVQDLDADVKTTEIYTHVMEKDISATLSPLDSI